MNTPSQIGRTYGWHRAPLPNFMLRAEYRGEPELAFTPKADLLKFQPPVFDQGAEGSCTACGVNGAARELHKVTKTAPDTHFSRQLTYWLERRDDGSGPDEDVGSSIAQSVRVVERYGLAPERLWPYTPKNFARTPTPEILKEAAKNKITGSVLVAQTLQALKSAIMSQRSVLFGFTVFSSFESDAVRKTGFMPMPKRGENVLGGHAVRAIGFDDSLQANGRTGHVRVRNSWGPEWGQGGDFWMPYAFFTGRNCSDFHILGRPA